VPPAVVFPGQGAQLPGAGQDWLDHPAWRVVEQAEAALDLPLAPLLLDADADLSRTRDSQLSVLLLSLVIWEAARETIGTPVAFAGHSLGQITALIASGAVGFDEGVRMASARAEATQRAADAQPGGMLALLGADADQARTACEAADGAAWPANLNAPGQIVVGGTPEGIDAVAGAAKGAGIRRARKLAVGGAFHTPLMAAAADELGPVLDAIAFSEPSAPVVANHDGAAHTRPGGWATHLRAHLVEPVRWEACERTMIDLGADELVEVGPGTTLTALSSRIAHDLPTRNISTPSDLETHAKAHA
jgi:[acyl-carrier-protein] S-malonyltransferase